jgi:hypothetical protein
MLASPHQISRQLEAQLRPLGMRKSPAKRATPRSPSRASGRAAWVASRAPRRPELTRRPEGRGFESCSLRVRC